ncbi:MAG: hypothetical protein C0478_09760 [Planctomyces sp.]|nr:hypothetical protein [Planctomyces sp.]
MNKQDFTIFYSWLSCFVKLAVWLMGQDLKSFRGGCQNGMVPFACQNDWKCHYGGGISCLLVEKS